MAGTGDQVKVATTLADAGGLGCSGVRGLVVTRFELLLDRRQHQITVLGTFGRGALQQALSTGMPPGRAADLAADEQTKMQPEGAAGRAQALADITIRIVGALERLEVFLVLAGQIRR